MWTEEMKKHLQTDSTVWELYGREISSLVIVGNVETSGAARCPGVLSPTTVIELGSIRWIIRSQFIVPFLVIMAATDEERRVEAT